MADVTNMETSEPERTSPFPYIEPVDFYESAANLDPMSPGVAWVIRGAIMGAEDREMFDFFKMMGKTFRDEGFRQHYLDGAANFFAILGMLKEKGYRFPTVSVDAVAAYNQNVGKAILQTAKKISEMPNRPKKIEDFKQLREFIDIARSAAAEAGYQDFGRAQMFSENPAIRQWTESLDTAGQSGVLGVYKLIRLEFQLEQEKL